MTENPLPDTGFLNTLTEVIERNLANEQFGVSELAEEMNMSRSNLLRKVKKESKLSVSQLINQVRLKRSMELLRKTSLNVSEVSHQVGFNSTSYFIKCFREYYGYPPGEVGRRNPANASAEMPSGEIKDEPIQSDQSRKIRRIVIPAGLILLIISLTGVIIWQRWKPRGSDEEKSIAVLPFKNDSNDSTNLYLINGLMESTLDKLQKIQGLRVVSRTSVEKFRGRALSIPEMASELDVRYFVEGSGQKMGDRILLNIQLVDAASDKHIWSKQYRRKADDIFELQEEIAKNITEEIQVVITPEENQKIAKKPTDDLLAYDYFLKGKDLFYRSGRGDLIASVNWFQKAIERDPEFSLAYATLVMVYYYLDIFAADKPHTADIDNYAEKAIIYDAKSSESMVAKALSFAQKGKYELAVPYLEKAFEYDPRSGLVLHFLTEFYNIHVPHPPKYLAYAIKKVQVDHAADSATRSFNYFHLSNALLQNGFLDDALRYNNKSLQLYPENFFAGFVNDYILYAKERDARKTTDRLLARWKKDTTRFDILHEAGKMSVICGDYKAASEYYDGSMATMKILGMDLFKHEYLRMALAYKMTGQDEKAGEYLKKFKDYADGNLTMYKDLHLASYYSYQNDTAKAMELFKRFANEQDNLLYWVLLIPSDPLLDNLRKHPEFDPAMKTLTSKFWRRHEEMKEKWEFEFRDL